MKIFVSGKISGLARADACARFESARAALASQGHSVFVPTVLPPYDDVTHEEYMKVCYAMVDICDAVYMLSNWRESKGARMELQYAADWRKTILYQDDSTREEGFPIRRGGL